MKLFNIKYLALVIALAALIVSGCGDKDKDTCPIFTENTGTTSSGEYKPGSPVNINFKLAANPDGKKITSITLWQSIDGAAEVAIQGYQFTDLNDDSKTVEYAALFPTKTGTVDYIIRYAEKGGCTNSKKYAYTLKDSVIVDMTPKAVTGVMSQANSCLSTLQGQVYTAAQASAVSADIDMTWLWTTAAGNNLIAPDWRGNTAFSTNAIVLAGAQQTRFKTTSMSQSEFESLKDYSLIKAKYDGGTATQVTGGNPDGARVTSIPGGGMGGQYQVGKVLAFVNGKGKYGLILIKSVAADASGGSELSIKMEK